MVRKLSAEKKACLLEAALQLFVEQGVQNTSTAEIAKAAGLAAGTLFLYFPTKQALLDALVLDIGHAQAENTKQQLNPTQPAQQMFLAIWTSSVEWFLEHPLAYQYVQQVRDTGLISAEAVAESAGYFSYYYEAIQKGLQEGSLKPYPLELIGGFLYQGIVATVNYARQQNDPAAAIRQGFDIFWDGIQVSPTRTQGD